MSFDDYAKKLRQQVRKTEMGFLTLSKKQLRQNFDIEKLTYKQAETIDQALNNAKLICVPHPYERVNNFRIVDRDSDLGPIAESLCRPDKITEEPLRRLAEVFARERLRRSPLIVDWQDALPLLLQSVLGQVPEGYDDLVPQRSPTVLAMDLARAMGLDPQLVEEPWLEQLARWAISCRPRKADLTTEWLGPKEVPLSSLQECISGIKELRENQSKNYQRLLASFQRLLMDGKMPEAIPPKVDLGQLGLVLS